MHSLEFLQDLAAVMIVAGLVTILFHRFKQPVVRTFIGRYRSVICVFLFFATAINYIDRDGNVVMLEKGEKT